MLCRREFSIKEGVQRYSFPLQWVKFGGDTGFPEESLWAIRWLDPSDEYRFDLPVDQVLIVYGNEKAEARLKAMGEVTGANDLAWRMLAAEITTQIWSDVLRKTEYEPAETDTETLIGQIFAWLSRVGQMPYADIRELAEQDDSLTELRGLVAKVFNVVS